MHLSLQTDNVKLTRPFVLHVRQILTRMIVFVFELFNCLFHHKLRHLTVVDTNCVIICLPRGLSPLVYQVELFVGV